MYSGGEAGVKRRNIAAPGVTKKCARSSDNAR